MPTPMRLRSTRLPDIKPGCSDEVERSPAVPKRRVGRPSKADMLAATAVAAGPSSPDKETMKVAARRPARRRVGKLEDEPDGIPFKSGFAPGGGWSVPSVQLPRNVTLALAALVSVLFLLLITLRPFAPRRLPPSLSIITDAGGAAPPSLVNRPLPAVVEPLHHPTHAELLAQGLKEYTYEKVISHRISLGPQQQQQPAAGGSDIPSAATAAGSSSTTNGGEPPPPLMASDAAAAAAAAEMTERKLREIADRYAIPFDELIRDMAELGQQAAAG